MISRNRSGEATWEEPVELKRKAVKAHEAHKKAKAEKAIQDKEEKDIHGWKAWGWQDWRGWQQRDWVSSSWQQHDWGSSSDSSHTTHSRSGGSSKLSEWRSGGGSGYIIEESMVANAELIADDWERHFCGKYVQTYYWNKRTGESQWAVPWVLVEAQREAAAKEEVGKEEDPPDFPRARPEDVQHTIGLRVYQPREGLQGPPLSTIGAAVLETPPCKRARLSEGLA